MITKYLVRIDMNGKVKDWHIFDSSAAALYNAERIEKKFPNAKTYIVIVDVDD